MNPPYYPQAFTVGVGNPMQPVPIGIGGFGMEMAGINGLSKMQLQQPMGMGSGVPVTQLMIGGPGAQYFSPSPYPMVMTCPHCKSEVQTRTRSVTSCLSHMVATALCVVGCCCFVWVPYYMHTFKDMEHSCPNCEKFIGVYRRL